MFHNNGCNKSTEEINLKSVLLNHCHKAYNSACEGPFGFIIRRLDKKFIKFLFVGFLNTLFGYSMYALFVSIQPSQATALLISYTLGVFWNFNTTGRLVFKNSKKSLILKFFCVYVFTYFVNLSGLNWLKGLGLGKYVSQAILVLPVAILSFIIFKYLVFKSETENDNNEI